MPISQTSSASRSFEIMWTDIGKRLLPSTLVRFWSAEQGYTGGAFHIHDTNGEAVAVLFGPVNTERRVPKSEFRRCFDSWENYSRGAVGRDELTKGSENASFVLSILQWWEETQSSPPPILTLPAGSLPVQPQALAAPAATSAQEYGKRVLQEATEGLARLYGPSVEVNYGGSLPVRIAATVGDIAVEVGVGVSRLLRGALLDLICHPNSKKLLLLVPDQLINSSTAAEHCGNILSRFCETDTFRVVMLRGSGSDPWLQEDAATVAGALASL